MDDDGDFGADADFVSALAASDGGGGSSQPAGPAVTLPARRQQPQIQQPTPQKIQQPAPQRLEPRATPASSSASAPSSSGIVQPTPQALPGRSSGSSILVSPRQKGNPVLACLRSLPWEYSDIPADYGLGLTTCALYLSLKYHRLHPEYIYTRIRNLQGKYNLRILLTMVDIPNHEDSLRELSKTSLVNNVTVMLCWSAAEAARYLELYKSYEHANFASIRGQQATSYVEKLVEFVTVPRSVNKTDAISLVSSFGSLRNAINGDPEQISFISGWGERKVKNWCKAVEEPFRVRTAAKRRRAKADGDEDGPDQARSRRMDQAISIGAVPLRDMAGLSATTAARSSGSSGDVRRGLSRQDQIWNPNIIEADEEEAASLAAAPEASRQTAQPARREEQVSEGVAAALAKLREKG